MAPTNILLNQQGHGVIDNIQLDCVLQEDHQYQNNVTDYPVEEGYNINDHVIRLPEQLTLQGIISNTPVSTDPVTENIAYKKFGELLTVAGYETPEEQTGQASSKKRAKIVSIVTGLRVYNQMIMTRFSPTRDSKSANILKFTADFKRIRIVKTETVTIANTSELMGKAPNIGKQAGETVKTGKTGADKAKDKGSLLTQISNTLTNFIK